VTEIREVLRAWLSGAGLRRVAEQAGVDCKTARRYVQAAAEAGLARDGGPGQLTDELVGQVAEAVRPVRPGGHGRPWDQLEACQDLIAGQVKAGLSVVKIGVLLERQGVVVPYRTLHRFCVERCGFGRTAATVRVPLSRQQDPQPLGHHCIATPNGRHRGEPVARRLARRIRRAVWGNGPRAITAPRPRPTQPGVRREVRGNGPGVIPAPRPEPAPRIPGGLKITEATDGCRP
jgi:hypothetical protein